MMYQITQIEFDLDPGDDSIPQEEMEQVQLDLQQEYIGSHWVAHDPDDLVEEVTNHSGWCIKSIDYVEDIV